MRFEKRIVRRARDGSYELRLPDGEERRAEGEVVGEAPLPSGAQVETGEELYLEIDELS